MYSCIICLNRSYNKYYNICDNCNNCIVCNNCYQNKQTQLLQVCCNCRQPLHKSFNYSWNTLSNILQHFRLIIIHILANIILTNTFITCFFPPKSLDIYFPQYLTTILTINNFSNIIIIPLIINYYKYYFNVIYVYSMFNIIFFILFPITKPKSHIQLFHMYIILYFYILSFFKFSLFSIHFLYKIFKIQIKLLYTNYNMNCIKIYTTYNIPPISQTSSV